MSCYSCGRSLGCKIDCPNAHWNWDASYRSSAFSCLKRLARWLMSIGSGKVAVLHQYDVLALGWMRPRRSLWS